MVYIFKDQIKILMQETPSDEQQQQGFISYDLQVVTPHQKPLQSIPQHPSDYLPRFIASNILLKKQNHLIYQHFDNFSFAAPSVMHADSQSPTKRVTSVSAKQKYLESPNYKLVFSRYSRSLSQDSTHFADNSVNLECLKTYDPVNYNLLRDNSFKFETIQSCKQDLKFESQFEGGNLLCAFKQNLTQSYILFMQNDTNSNGYNQWFYFTIENADPAKSYKFQIVNFVMFILSQRKKFSFFRQGMQPAIFSQIKAEIQGNGWSRQGSNISYTTSPICGEQQREKYYSLSFTLQFEYNKDIVSISPNPPYSYSRLIQKIKKYGQIAQQHGIDYHMSCVAHTVADNQVPLITISHQLQYEKTLMGNEKNSYIQAELYRKKSFVASDKKVIVIMARQHPGETWSSYLMEFILKVLVKNESPYSKYLLDNFIFKVFPMVNVDGVIYGNFRCDLTGMDLNRQWKDPSKLLHPSIYNIKEYIIKISKSHKIATCIDLHGHSKQYGIFSYGCSNGTKRQEQLDCRVLSFIISKIDRNFIFNNCTFGISKFKQNTARAMIYSIVKQPNVITIESSFYSPKKQTNNEFPVKKFDPEDFFEMANAILAAMASYYKNDKFKKECEKELQSKLDQILRNSSRSQDMGNISGSDSEPECDEIDIKIKFGQILSETTIQELQKRNQKAVEKSQSSFLLQQRDQSDPRLRSEEPKEQVISERLFVRRTGPSLKKNMSTKNASESTETNKKIADINRKNLIEDVKIPDISNQLHQKWLKKRKSRRTTLTSKPSQILTPEKQSANLEISMKRLQNYLKDKKKNNDQSFEKSFTINREKRHDRAEKILKIRKRANTFKRVDPADSTFDNVEPKFLLIRSEFSRTEKQPPSAPNFASKASLESNLFKSIFKINKQLIIVSKNNNGSNRLPKQRQMLRNSELIASIWKQNYDRYEKDLK